MQIMFYINETFQTKNKIRYNKKIYISIHLVCCKILPEEVIT